MRGEAAQHIHGVLVRVQLLQGKGGVLRGGQIGESVGIVDDAVAVLPVPVGMVAAAGRRVEHIPRRKTVGALLGDKLGAPRLDIADMMADRAAHQVAVVRAGKMKFAKRKGFAEHYIIHDRIP